MGKHSSPLDKVERAKRIMSNLKKCGIVWMVCAVIVFIIGILLLIFFAKYVNTEEWQRGVGITGIVFLLAGVVAFIIGLVIIWSFCHMVARQQEAVDHSSHKTHTNSFPTNLYPRQPGYDAMQNSPHHGAGGYPGGNRSAPHDPASADGVVIETDGKY